MYIYEPKGKDQCQLCMCNGYMDSNAINSNHNEKWFCENVISCTVHDWITCPAVKHEYGYLCRLLTEHMFDISDIPISSDRWNLIRSREHFKTKFISIQGRIKEAGGLPGEE